MTSLVARRFTQKIRIDRSQAWNWNRQLKLFLHFFRYQMPFGEENNGVALLHVIIADVPYHHLSGAVARVNPLFAVVHELIDVRGTL